MKLKVNAYRKRLHIIKMARKKSNRDQRKNYSQTYSADLPRLQDQVTVPNSNASFAIPKSQISGFKSKKCKNKIKRANKVITSKYKPFSRA